MTPLAWLMLGGAFALVLFTLFDGPRTWLLAQYGAVA